MTIENAKAVLNELEAKVQAGDVEGGKSALARMKVRKNTTIERLFVMK